MERWVWQGRINIAPSYGTIRLESIISDGNCDGTALPFLRSLISVYCHCRMRAASNVYANQSDEAGSAVTLGGAILSWIALVCIVGTGSTVVRRRRGNPILVGSWTLTTTCFVASSSAPLNDELHAQTVMRASIRSPLIAFPTFGTVANTGKKIFHRPLGFCVGIFKAMARSTLSRQLPACKSAAIR
ncbi:hypothetical protein EDC04DRAFT_2721755 [Pisolithus marmoratus]|nr:hypothetical protein EDC04DRAFT_2721755 [Pisolithus marmoratus]